MARTSFTLAFETTAPDNNPSRPTPGGPNVTVTKVDEARVQAKIIQGRATPLGYIFQDMDDVLSVDVGADAAAYTASSNCVIVYIGGTAYRICS